MQNYYDGLQKYTLGFALSSFFFTSSIFSPGGDRLPCFGGIWAAEVRKGRMGEGDADFWRDQASGVDMVTTFSYRRPNLGWNCNDATIRTGTIAEDTPDGAPPSRT